MSWLAAVVRLVFISTVLSAPVVAHQSSHASSENCSASVGMWGYSSTCTWSYPEYQQASSSGDGRTWHITVHSANGGIHKDDLVCNEDGETGIWYDVFVDGEDVGDVCVPDRDVKEVDMAELVVRQFKRIEWPASKLVVQPRGGKTLVNFKTNFYTPDHRLIDRSVTVAGQQVTIRAVPVSYAWFFGDDTSTTTTSPGSPHPNLEITHEYSRVDEVVVRLDTTYAGEYRIGNGDWASIPETLTVAGESQELAIVEALPQLVLR
jgi:hypothetical protein